MYVDVLSYAKLIVVSTGGLHSRTEISLILKNKMAAAGISLKIIYLFLLAASHR